MSSRDERERDAIDRIREDAADGELRDEIENMSEEEIAKALADAGTSADAARAQVREVLGEAAPPKKDETAKIVPLAQARAKRSPTTWVGFAVAAAILAFIAWQWAKQASEPDVPVASPFDAGMDAEQGDAPRTP